MLTSFKSHFNFSGSRKRGVTKPRRGFSATNEWQSASLFAVSASTAPTKHRRGFTLVELLIVIAITALISTVVAVRFSSFDSTILLKNLAYEIAVSLRETQVYSLSVLGTNPSFDYPYGMSFEPGSKEYTFFQYPDSDPDVTPQYSNSDYALNTFTIGRSLKVVDVCVFENNTEHCSDEISRLDISFRRPDFDALIFADGYSGPIESARIKVGSESSNDVWIIDVSLLGQITVYLES